MTPAEFEAELVLRQRRLTREASRRDVRADLAETDRLADRLMAEQLLSPNGAITILQIALLFRRAARVMRTLAYLRERCGDHEIVLGLERYLGPGKSAGGEPAEADLVRAEYALKAAYYNVASRESHDLLSSAFVRFSRRLRFNGPARVADLACGTGLVGRLLRGQGFTGELVGVDLSAEMLALAAEDGCYTALVCADLVDYLNREPGRFDAVLAMQVVAMLDPAVVDALLAAVRRRLKPQGVLIINGSIYEDLPDAEAAKAMICRIGCSTFEHLLKTHGFAFRFFDHGDERRYYTCSPV
ncbi:MAG: class I SAM-dependent methyltransferase [Rhodospirillaceae bacterium]